MRIFFTTLQNIHNIKIGNTLPASSTTARSRTSAALAAGALALLSACGGGGGGSGGDAPSTALPPASDLAQQCEANGTGTLSTEKSWVRSFVNDTYLWYKDVPQVDASTFTAANYTGSSYRALDAYLTALKTPLRTASGKPVDQFSFTIPTADLINQQSGVASGYGIRFTAISRVPPRIFRVLFVEPGSPAQIAGIQRGDTVRSVDGLDIDVTSTEDRAKLNAGLSPTIANKTTVFGMQAPGAAAPRLISVISSQSIAVSPVPTSTTLTQGTSTVGYLVLNSFSIRSAEKQLIDSVTQLKAASVNELVLDLRYNGGGFLDISNQLAYMIGSNSLTGKLYEKIVCNDKNPFAICNSLQNFRTTSLGFSQPAGQALPQLNLQRVFVLTSASTCSASESLINGLSPFIQVVRIGSGTCGKPYGFYYTDNCGTSYAAMQFAGQNSAGFGDYADGFAPTCQVGDDLSKARGDTSERMLAAALTYMGTGACPAPSTVLQKAGVESADNGNYRVMRSPVEEQRLLGGPTTYP
jgi:carboxyl-terminal processing protease